MAYTTIDKSSLHFNTKLYTGTGAENAVTGINFQPDWTWIKSRNATYDHTLYDAVRGATKQLYSNHTNGQYTEAQGLKSFDSDGFTNGTDAKGNNNGTTFVSWNWKANGSGSANSDGDITSTVSVNTTSGFSIVKYTGDGTTGQTVGHGLGSVPKLIINKQLTTQNWFVYHHSIGNTKVLKLNTTGAETTSSAWNNTTPTSSVFTIGTSASTNVSGENFINYCFAEKQGFSKFGSYKGNGNDDGAFIYTGFKPAFILVKNAAITDNWSIFDNKRLGYNAYNYVLYADITNVGSNGLPIDILSNGFKWRTSAAMVNGSGNNCIFMAFAEAPLVGSNNVPATAR